MFTVSMNAAVISRKGCMSLRLRQLAIQIYQFCARHGVILEVEWIPRSFNHLADAISRTGQPRTSFSQTLIPFLDHLMLIDLRPAIQPNALGSTLSFGARAPEVSMRSVLTGLELTIGLYHPFVLFLEQFSIWKIFTRKEPLLLLNGLPRPSGPSFSLWALLGRLLCV